MATATQQQTTPAPAQPARGELVSTTFGGTAIQAQAETAMAAAAARAKALVEARFVMAMQRPRDWNDVRRKILDAIERPGFAGRHGEKSKPGEAWFHKPVGDGVEGLSIRFAEEAARCMGNLDVQPVITYEDDEKRLLDVMVIDLEANLAYTQSIVVPKTVERSYLKKGEVALRTRINSQNKPVYTRSATEDEVAQTQGILVSKAIRNGVLRVLPGDIQAAATERIQQIRFGDAATDPSKVQREVADAFAKLNVRPSAIADYLGHDLASSSPAELAHLRDLYKAIKGGETTWADAVRAAGEEGDGEAPQQPTSDPKPGLAGVTERLQAQQQGGQAPQQPAATEQPQAEPAGREPGADDGDDAPSTAAPPACDHPSVPPSRLAQTPVGKSVVCSDCGEELPGEKPAEPAKRGQRRLEE